METRGNIFRVGEGYSHHLVPIAFAAVICCASRAILTFCCATQGYQVSEIRAYTDGQADTGLLFSFFLLPEASYNIVSRCCQEIVLDIVAQ